MTDTGKPTSAAPAGTTPDAGYHPASVEAKWKEYIRTRFGSAGGGQRAS